MRIKTQNMIVLTVEFTRTPLSWRGRMPSGGTSSNAASIFRRLSLHESVRKCTTPSRQTRMACRRMSSNPNCTPKAEKVGVPQRSKSSGIRGINRSGKLLLGAEVGRAGASLGRSFDGDSGLRLQFHATHPDDATVQFEDRPEGSAGSSNLQTFKDFLDFSGAA